MALQADGGSYIEIDEAERRRQEQLAEINREIQQLNETKAELLDANSVLCETCKTIEEAGNLLSNGGFINNGKSTAELLINTANSVNNTSESIATQINNINQRLDSLNHQAQSLNAGEPFVAINNDYYSPAKVDLNLKPSTSGTTFDEEKFFNALELVNTAAISYNNAMNIINNACNGITNFANNSNNKYYDMSGEDLDLGRSLDSIVNDSGLANATNDYAGNVNVFGDAFYKLEELYMSIAGIEESARSTLATMFVHCTNAASGIFKFPERLVDGILWVDGALCDIFYGLTSEVCHMFGLNDAAIYLENSAKAVDATVDNWMGYDAISALNEDFYEGIGSKINDNSSLKYDSEKSILERNAVENAVDIATEEVLSIVPVYGKPLAMAVGGLVNVSREAEKGCDYDTVFLAGLTGVGVANSISGLVDASANLLTNYELLHGSVHVINQAVESTGNYFIQSLTNLDNFVQTVGATAEMIKNDEFTIGKEIYNIGTEYLFFDSFAHYADDYLLGISDFAGFFDSAIDTLDGKSKIMF